MEKSYFPRTSPGGNVIFLGEKSSYFPNVHAENYSERQTSTMYVESNSFVTLKKQKFCDWFTFYDNYHVSFTNSNNV